MTLGKWIQRRVFGAEQDLGQKVILVSELPHVAKARPREKGGIEEMEVSDVE